MVDLPSPFSEWFAARRWLLHDHQAALLARGKEPATLLIAPTGGGKTLAGFLPSLTELASKEHTGLHTLYVSPLKALAADIRRNLEAPVAEMKLPIRIEDRTGDTNQTTRKRQRVDPPHILLTTPESLALLLSYEDAARTFKGLQRVIVDEIHALADSKRGDQLMLNLSRLEAMVPGLRRVGLSATVEDPPAIARFLARHPDPCDIVHADPGPAPDIAMLTADQPPPWSGAGATYSAPAVLEAVKGAKTTLIFINTRAQAEIYFRALWQANTDDLPIALHHGSLARSVRDKVEAAMLAGELRAIVCTGTLDLGIDWGDVDLVVQIGAPKNVKRLVQRIGRSNHRYNAPSRALIVPANRWEVLECQAALDAVRDATLDGEPRPDAPLDVLCQHILIRACAGPFGADALFDEVRTAGPFCDLPRADFDACLTFCATGGYALRVYDKWQRLQERDGLWRLRDPRAVRNIRMNLGTIVDSETLKVRMRRARGGKPLGEVEEAFAATLVQGDTFLIGGQVVRYEGLREMTVEVSREPGRKPKIAVFSGTKFAASTLLTERMIAKFATGDWQDLPAYISDWIELQRKVSALPQPGRMLVERFVRDDTHYTCVYGFAGRNALQTLGLLLTQRMEDQGLRPLGFVCNDYAVLIWGLDLVQDPRGILTAEGLRAGFEGWLNANAVMKRSFRTVATIAGLIERNQPGHRKSGRQATFSSDILYDTLQKYDPEHLMLRITRAEAMRGLVDYGRIEDMLAQFNGRIDTVSAPHLTPFAAPLLMEVGKVPILGAGREDLQDEGLQQLMHEAGLNRLEGA